MARFKRFLIQLFESTAGLFFDPPVVLTYHRVGRPLSDIHSLSVAPQNFSEQMEYLSKDGPTSFFSEIRPGKRGSCVTFDDGYADNLLAALPIIERHKVKATFFVSTDLLGTTELLWWDDLEATLFRHSQLPSSLDFDGRRWELDSPKKIRGFHDEIYRLAFVASRDERSRLLSRLHQALRFHPTAVMYPEYRQMTVEELQRLAKSAFVEIGAHTCSHTRLSNLPLDQQIGELRGSVRKLEELLGRPVRVASYPFGGRRDFSVAGGRALMRDGLKMVAANFPMRYWPWIGRARVPRFVVRNWAGREFIRFVSEIRRGRGCAYYS